MTNVHCISTVILDDFRPVNSFTNFSSVSILTMKVFLGLILLVLPYTNASPANTVKRTTVQGFDISHYQGTVDFASAYSSGARFVIIKVKTSMSPSPSRDPSSILAISIRDPDTKRRSQKVLLTSTPTSQATTAAQRARA